MSDTITVSKHHLLTPLNIGNQTINNRMMLAPMAGRNNFLK